MLYVTAQQYFYHGRHKEFLDQFDTQRTCGWKCPNVIGVPMQYFELWWPNICVLLISPFVVKQQVGSEPAKQDDSFADEIVAVKPEKKATIVWSPPFLHHSFEQEMNKVITIFLVYQTSKMCIHHTVFDFYLKSVFCSRMFMKWCFDFLQVFVPFGFMLLWR